MPLLMSELFVLSQTDGESNVICVSQLCITFVPTPVHAA